MSDTHNPQDGGGSNTTTDSDNGNSPRSQENDDDDDDHPWAHAVVATQLFKNSYGMDSSVVSPEEEDGNEDEDEVVFGDQFASRNNERNTNHNHNDTNTNTNTHSWTQEYDATLENRNATARRTAWWRRGIQATCGLDVAAAIVFGLYALDYYEYCCRTATKSHQHEHDNGSDDSEDEDVTTKTTRAAWLVLAVVLGLACLALVRAVCLGVALWHTRAVFRPPQQLQQQRLRFGTNATPQSCCLCGRSPRRHARFAFRVAAYVSAVRTALAVLCTVAMLGGMEVMVHSHHHGQYDETNNTATFFATATATTATTANSWGLPSWLVTWLRHRTLHQMVVVGVIVCHMEAVQWYSIRAYRRRATRRRRRRDNNADDSDDRSDDSNSEDDDDDFENNHDDHFAQNRDAVHWSSDDEFHEALLPPSTDRRPHFRPRNRRRRRQRTSWWPWPMRGWSTTNDNANQIDTFRDDDDSSNDFVSVTADWANRTEDDPVWWSRDEDEATVQAATSSRWINGTPSWARNLDQDTANGVPQHPPDMV